MPPARMTLLLLPLLATTASTSLDPTRDKYCGVTQTDASARCQTPCPSGNDRDCPEGQRCRTLAGCRETSHGSKNDENLAERPRRDLVDLPDFLGLDTLLSSSTIDDDSSHGIIFDVETASDAGVVRVTHLEFYSSHERGAGRDGNDESGALDGVAVVMDYQVYIKEGTWHDAPSAREYQLVSDGSMALDRTIHFHDDDSNNDSNNDSSSRDERARNNLTYTRHRIPLTTKIKLNGNGTRYSFYFGISRRILLYQRPSAISDDASPTTKEHNSDDTPDNIPLLRTNEMTIYYGAATMIYPLSKANHPVFYRRPRGFVGRIWYERDACVPSVVDWEECRELKRPLSAEAMESVVETGTVYYGGLETEDTGGGKPSMSAAPTKDDGNKVYLVITFAEAPLGTLMDESAQASFERVLFDYYASLDVLSENEVDLYSVEMWYQQFLIKQRGNRQMRNSNNGNSQPFHLSNDVQSTNSAPGASIAQYQVTVIISVMHSLLPEVITRDLLQNALSENTSSFLKSLKLTPSLTPYLQNTGYISSVVAIDELTSPPTRSPTLAPTILITEPIVVVEPAPPYVIASILVGAIYTCSMIFSTCYIKRARNEMEYDHDVKALLRSTTMEDGVRPDTSVPERKEEMSIGKMRRMGSSWRANFKMSRAGDVDKNCVNESDEDEDESRSWERTSSAEEDSSSSSGEESSSDEPEGLSIT